MSMRQIKKSSKVAQLSPALTDYILLLANLNYLSAV